MVCADSWRDQLLRRSGRPELFQQPAEAAFVEHVVEVKLLGEQTGCFRAQEEPFDGDVPVGPIARHNQEAKSIHASLESPVGLFAGYHALV